MCPRRTLREFLQGGYYYHITICLRDRTPAQAFLNPASRLNRIRAAFLNPVRAHLRVNWMDHRTSVARLSPNTVALAQLVTDIRFMRQWFGNHGWQDLTVSM